MRAAEKVGDNGIDTIHLSTRMDVTLFSFLLFVFFFVVCVAFVVQYTFCRIRDLNMSSKIEFQVFYFELTMHAHRRQTNAGRFVRCRRTNRQQSKEGQ